MWAWVCVYCTEQLQGQGQIRCQPAGLTISLEQCGCFPEVNPLRQPAEDRNNLSVFSRDIRISCCIQRLDPRRASVMRDGLTCHVDWSCPSGLHQSHLPLPTMSSSKRRQGGWHRVFQKWPAVWCLVQPGRSICPQDRFMCVQGRYCQQDCWVLGTARVFGEGILHFSRSLLSPSLAYSCRK